MIAELVSPLSVPPFSGFGKRDFPEDEPRSEWNGHFLTWHDVDISIDAPAKSIAPICALVPESEDRESLSAFLMQREDTGERVVVPCHRWVARLAAFHCKVPELTLVHASGNEFDGYSFQFETESEDEYYDKAAEVAGR